MRGGIMHLVKKWMIIIFLPGAILFPALADDWAVDQGSAYAKGDKTINAGFALWPFGLSASFDYGFHQAISAGYVVGIMIFPDSYVPMVVRAAFHPFNLAVWKDKISVRDKLDAYAGLSSGLKIGFDPLFTVSEYIGARYFFTPKFAVYAEDCAGIGYLNFGISFKL